MSKIPEGATHWRLPEQTGADYEFYKHHPSYEGWAQYTRGTWWTCKLFPGWENLKNSFRPIAEHPDYVSPSLQGQQVGRLHRVWNGEGPPPVGTVCEIQYSTCHAWVVVRIEWKSASQVLFSDHATGNAHLKDRSDVTFRVYRTPEQIAADEREEAVKALYQVLTVEASKSYAIQNYGDAWEKLAAAVYNAGYRKP